MRIVVDTNVILSALANTSSSPGQILRLWQEGIVELLATEETIAELERVLNYPKVRNWLKYTDAEMRALVALFRHQTLLIEVSEVPDVSPDPKDNIFLALAEVGSAHYLVTGDKKHLLPLEEYQGIPVVSPAVFLTIYTEQKT